MIKRFITWVLPEYEYKWVYCDENVVKFLESNPNAEYHRSYGINNISCIRQFKIQIKGWFE